MDAEAANKFYEDNKKYIADKIEILDLALASMKDAIQEASEKHILEGAYYDLEDFRDKQAKLIFEEIVSHGFIPD